MQPADPTAQAFFDGQPAMLRKFVPPQKSADTPDFDWRATDSLAARVDPHLWSPLADSLRAAPFVLRADVTEGVPGDPAPRRLRDDDVVTSTLLLSFVFMMWVIAASWKFLRHTVKDFYHHRTRPNLFADRVDTELRGRFFLVAQTCFLQGILFMDSVQDLLPDAAEARSPYPWLVIGTLAVGIYYAAKLALYNFVNTVFFDAARRRLWNDTFFVSILTVGVFLMPVTLLVVFFDLPFTQALSTYVLLMAIVKILLLYKAHRIFFDRLSKSLHLILYFCALEIAPLLFLWGLLVTIARYGLHLI